MRRRGEVGGLNQPKRFRIFESGVGGFRMQPVEIWMVRFSPFEVFEVRGPGKLGFAPNLAFLFFSEKDERYLID